MIGVTELSSKVINIEIQLMKKFDSVLVYSRSIVFRSTKIIPLYFVQFRLHLMY